MEKINYKLGERVEKYCTVCSQQLGHLIKSLTKQGKISRVICSKCNLSGTFKQSAKIEPENESGKTFIPYSQSQTYRSGQYLMHPTFGAGEVLNTLSTRTIDVLFADQVRRLIHSRN